MIDVGPMFCHAIVSCSLLACENERDLFSSQLPSEGREWQTQWKNSSIQVHCSPLATSDHMATMDMHASCSLSNITHKAPIVPSWNAGQTQTCAMENCGGGGGPKPPCTNCPCCGVICQLQSWPKKPMCVCVENI